MTVYNGLVLTFVRGGFRSSTLRLFVRVIHTSEYVILQWPIYEYNRVNYMTDSTRERNTTGTTLLL